MARVKKIINTDEDINTCSNNAAFVITAATEMFLQYLVEQSFNVVRSERKPRRNIQYRDVANAVARVENLEFLADVVPKTTTYKAFKQNMATAKTASAKEGDAGVANGQGTLDAHVNGGAGVRDGKDEVEGEGQGVEEEQAVNGASHEAMEVVEATSPIGDHPSPRGGLYMETGRARRERLEREAEAAGEDEIMMDDD